MRRWCTVWSSHVLKVGEKSFPFISYKACFNPFYFAKDISY
jgi:hypothetical protein